MDKIFRNSSLPKTQGPAARQGAGSSTWRQALPVLTGRAATLREPAPGDAPALMTAIDARDLVHVLPADAQATLQSIEAMIAECQRQRAAGTGASWVIVPAGEQAAIGLVTVRGLDHGFTMVEASAAIAEEFRGTGLFQDAGHQLLDCLFGALGVHRLEARVDVRNARANGALRNLGATQEGVLRHAHYRDGRYHDHVMWAIVAEDWTQGRNIDRVSIH